MKLSGANILIIEHDSRNLANVLQIFGDNYHIQIARTGKEGYRLTQEKEYDLHFIAMDLPDMSGLDVLNKITKLLPESLCVMMGKNTDVDLVFKAAKSGCYDFLKVPLKHSKLEQLIPRALERKWYMNEARRLTIEKEENLHALAEEKSRLRTVINSIDDGVMITNQRQEVIFSNPRFLNLIGMKREIMVGEKIFDILPKKLQHQITSITESHVDACIMKEEIVITPPAQLVIMANSAPIQNSKNDLIGVVTVLRDITEIKALELSKSQFINMVVHELKAPLGAIQGNLELVIKKELGEQDPLIYDRYLERSLDRSKAMISLLQDLLNIFRMDARTVQRDIENIDAGKLMEETVEFFNSSIREKNIKLNMKIATPVIIKADREEIRRIYTNLISNAIKYNRDGGLISIQVIEDNNYAKITVRDTGIGMTPEDKNRLFEEFFRAKNKYTRRVSGTGLGMTILKKIIDEYAGKIQVKSNYEQGSKFTVFLPLSSH